MAKTRCAASTTAAMLLVVLAACGDSRMVEQQQVQECVRCHGGKDSTIGPPLPGAHISHLSAPHGISGPVACETCHVVPSTVSSVPSHMDGTVEVSFNAFARHDVPQAAWDRAGQTCNVYCHGATLSGGSAKSPVWTNLDGSARQCGSCHGFPPPRPHPQRDDCATCHPATVGATGIITGGAHLDGDVDVDYAAMGCTDCHGDAQRVGSNLLKAAPPIGTHAETATSTLAVGAHQAHLVLSQTSVAQPIACAECHVVPGTPAHSNDRVDIAFGSLATTSGATPSWDRAGATCSSTYCHGATVGGGTNKSPVWTAGASQAACGTCHGTPPPPPHPSGTQCNTCHPSTVNADGTLNVAGGAHVNGSLEVEKYHPTGWRDPTAHGYAANRGPPAPGLASCKGCHGADLTGGGVGVSCDTCHNAVPGVVDWRTNCTFCHGDPQRAANKPAPPVGTEGELGTTDRAVGAHQKHVVDGNIRQAVACTECHAVPADILQPQHVNGIVDIAFEPSLAATGGATPSWDHGTATCSSTYCHGATLHGGAAKTPVWTKVDGTQDRCDSCHGSPPPTKADGSPHPQLTTCRACHSLTVAADAHPDHTIDVAGGKHIDGQVEVTSYHPTGWAAPTSHGYAANRDFASCKVCHGADLNGGDVGVSCNACHASKGHADWQTECTFCHGDPQRAANKPAPPVGTEGETLTSDRAVGAHQAHLAGTALGKPIACTQCHVLPADISHLDGKAALAWGSLATARSTVASFNTSNLSCANYCHGATLGGGARTNPVWTATGQATCGSCHGLPPPAPHPVVTGGPAACHNCHLDTVDAAGAIIPASAGGRHLNGVSEAQAHDASWMDTSSPGFHAIAANAGLGTCQNCHGVNLDGPSPQSACASCHTQGGRAPDLAACTGCHGGTDNSTGAPPRVQWAFRNDASEASLRSGAHTTHVTTDKAAPIGCGVCHQTPTDMFSAGHIDASTSADVVFSGIALTAAPWDRSNPSCSVYCHGATLSGGSNTSPTWTAVGQGQAACGRCHGLPPPAPHPAVTGGVTVCNACHPQTVDASGAIIPASAGGLHLDGTVQKVYGHELATWMNTASPGFHAYSANQGLSNCQVCHGTNLDGPTAQSACAYCHRAGGTAPELTCTGCHGGTQNQTGAPPRVQWAFRNDAAEASLRTGAHTTHLSVSEIAPTIGCSVCHTTPADMFAQGHIDPATAANVVFTGLAANGMTPAPTWNRTAPTCAVYCHGATLPGGSLTTPAWTAVGQGQAACGTCHGVPPPNPPHPTVGTSLVGCHDCHPDTIDAAGAIIAPLAGGKHLNGLIDGGHLPSWISPASVTNPDFHAYSANRGLANCRLCHGPLLDGVGGSTNVGCQNCHDGSTAPQFWVGSGDQRVTLCTGCHGGTDNQTGAPPRATWGNTNAVAIGAHSSHVGTNPVSAPIACAECHVAPTDMFSAGHIDPSPAEVVFQGPISAQSGGTWNYPTTGTPTCSSTYCHGDFLGGIDQTRPSSPNTPNWTGTNQAACGSCHNARPQGYLHRRHERQDYTGIQPWWPVPGESGWVTCDQCHVGIAQSVTNADTPTLTQVNGGGPPLHVNGRKDVVFKLGGSYDPITQNCSSMRCHPGEVKTW